MGAERREEKICRMYFHTASQFGLAVTRSVYPKKTWSMRYKNTNKHAVAFETQHTWVVMMEGRVAQIRCIQRQRTWISLATWHCEIINAFVIYTLILRHPLKCTSWQAIWNWHRKMTATFSFHIGFFKEALNWFHTLHTYLTDILKEKHTHRYVWQRSEVYFFIFIQFLREKCIFTESFYKKNNDK